MKKLDNLLNLVHQLRKKEELSIATNVPKLTTPDSTFNVFGSLDWVVEKGWPSVSKRKINDKPPKETSNNETI